MAYNKQELERLSLDAIEEHNIKFVSYLVSYLPCAESTFYAKKLDKSEAIKEALNKNRIKAKSKKLSHWEKENAAPVLQAMYFKLLADDDELDRLNNNDRKKEEDKEDSKAINISFGFETRKREDLKDEQ